MKLIPTFLVCLILLACLSNSVRAQSPEQTDARDTDIYIPPLYALIDSAIQHNALVKFRDLGIVGKQSNLHNYQTYWSRNLGIQADMRYGTFNNFSTNAPEGTASTMVATSTVQTNYGVGVFFKFPLQDAINRRSELRMAKSELEQAESMAVAQRDELRQAVIKQYNDVLLKQKLLNIRSKSLSDSRVNMDMVQKEFQNGVVSVTEYARISDIVTTSEINFETSRTEFITSYMILEEMVGFKFRHSKK